MSPASHNSATTSIIPDPQIPVTPVSATAFCHQMVRSVVGTLAATGALAWWATLHLAWYWWPSAFLLYGMCYAFMINGFHELVHSSVFRTQWLNVSFLYLFSFLGRYKP